MTQRFDRFRKRLEGGETIILNGAMGTEIQRRGVSTKLPLWSAAAIVSDPEVVKQIHRDYIEAGSDILTTNTFRTNIRTLRKAGLTSEDARRSTRIAYALADEARRESGVDHVIIGGEMAPVEDCYRLDLVPSDVELRVEHREWGIHLAECGVDFLFVETMNCVRESIIAIEEAAKTGLPVALSFLSTPEGTMFSGEDIGDLVRSIAHTKPFAICLNCRPPDALDKALSTLLSCSSVPVGVYANGLGKPDDDQGWIFEGSMPEDTYLQYALRWKEQGVQIIGGCCGTTPAYIRRISEHRRQNS